MGFHLREGLAACLCGRKAVFLDVCADRYFCLGERDDDLFRELIAMRPPQTISRNRIEPLLRAGIIEENDTPTSVCDSLSCRPGRQNVAADSGLGSIYWRDLFWAIASQYRAAAMLNLAGLAPVLRMIRKKKALCRGRGQPVTEEDWQRLRVSFAKTRMLRPRSVHCLTSSIAFLDRTLAKGFVADLVIGVRAAPFAAHCWVQVDDLILNDSAETVSRFVPILTV